MYSTLNTGIVKKGTEILNGLERDIKGWKIVLIKHEEKDGGVYINVEELKEGGKYEYIYNNWIERESDLAKFFAETDWEIEWEK